MAKFKIPEQLITWSMWALWWFIVGGAGVWLLVGSVAYWVKHGWLPPDTSGWVQAIGSIGAISVAAWAALYATKANQRAAVSAEKARIKVIRHAMCELAMRGMAAVEMLRILINDPEAKSYKSSAKFAMDRLENEWRNAQQIKLTDLPSADLIKVLLELLLLLEHSGSVARKVVSDGAFPRERVALDRMNAEFDKLISALRASL